MPQIKNNFTLKSKSPNFDRDSFISKNAMKEMPTAWMDEGHISYCQEDGNHYTFSVLNKFDTETGYFKLFKDSEELTEIQRDIDDLYARINNLPTGGGDNNIPEGLMDILNDLIARVNELYAKEYPVTCSLNISGGTVLEYNPYDSTQTSHTKTLTIGVQYKGSNYPREDLEELTIDGPSGCTIGAYDKTSTSVNVVIPLAIKGTYKFTLTIKTKDGQTKTASCTMYQRALSYVRYSDMENAGSDLFVAKGDYSNLFKNTLTTSLDGLKTDFHFTEADGIIPTGSYLWIMAPDGVTLPSKVYGNGYEAQLEKDENGAVKKYTVNYGSCPYTCIRGFGKTEIPSQDMKITFYKP